MFDLETAVAQWRQDLARQSGLTAEVLDELEAHLRDDVTRQVAGGRPAEEAFREAAARLGEPRALVAEFAKVNAARPTSWLPAWVVLALAGLAAVAVLLMVGARLRPGEQPLLAFHVAAVTLGYGATLCVGLLAACYVAARPFGDLAAGQKRFVYRVTFGLTAGAAVLTLLGVGLGGVWANENLGRFWGWDPKEVGGALVLAWQAGVLVALWRRWPGEHAALVLGLVGDIVVGLAWFGPPLLPTGLHGYAFPPGWLLPLLLGLAVAHAGLLALGFLVRPGVLRRSRA